MEPLNRNLQPLVNTRGTSDQINRTSLVQSVVDKIADFIKMDVMNADQVLKPILELIKKIQEAQNKGSLTSNMSNAAQWSVINSLQHLCPSLDIKFLCIRLFPDLESICTKQKL